MASGATVPQWGRVFRWQGGFTMIELMITIVIAAILLAVGVPSYRAVLQNSRASAVASDFTSAINLARSEAVRRGLGTQLCPSINGTTCGGSWADGWIVRDVGNDVVLRAWSAPTDGTAITQTPSANSALDFGELGQLRSGDTRLVAQVQGCSGQRARTLDLSASGRVSVQRSACP